MKNNKLKIYSLEITLFIILFVAIIVSSKITYITLSLILLMYTIILKTKIKTKKVLSMYKKQILFFMLIFGLIYIGIFYLLGLYIYDFSKAPTLFGIKTIYKFIIPLTIIIISTETIREAFISQNEKINILKHEIDISKSLTFINTVLIDVIIYSRVYDIKKFDDFMTITGFIVFASISCNMFYNYVTKRYGKNGVIAYKLITILYIYIIPIIPNMYIYFRSFLKMLYPYIMYIILEYTYSKTNFAVAYKDKKKRIIGITMTLVLATSLTMLISCEYKYGIIVIGSESMTGTINIGDAVLFEKYTNQKIKKGDIIIFKMRGLTTIHRVIKIENINNEIRYITKGDANEQEDDIYQTTKNIIGIKKLKIKYIGYPTIWLREMFN